MFSNSYMLPGYVANVCCLIYKGAWKPTYKYHHLQNISTYRCCTWNNHNGYIDLKMVYMETSKQSISHNRISKRPLNGILAIYAFSLESVLHWQNRERSNYIELWKKQLHWIVNDICKDAVSQPSMRYLNRCHQSLSFDIHLLALSFLAYAPLKRLTRHLIQT